MSSEKMQILRMLEEGKINADEASRLLQSVGVPEHKQSGGGSERHFQPSGERPAQSNGPPQGTRTSAGIGSTTGLDDFATDLRRKFGTLAKDMEPKIQRFVGTVAVKTSDMADRISKNINEAEARVRTAPASTQQSGDSVAKAKPTYDPRASVAAAAARDFELKVTPGYNELDLKAHNGDITVNGYNGDKLTLKVFAKEQRAGARIELLRLGGRYCLSYDADDFKTVSVDALVPEKLFAAVILGTANGRTNVANITTEHFTVQSSNGASAFRGIRAENMHIDSSNGRLSFEEISAQNARIEGSGGQVDAIYLDVANLRLLTSNSAITMNNGDFRLGADYAWIIETSNGKVTLNVPSSPQNGYYINAATSLGGVRLGLPALHYMSQTPNQVEAMSTGYDSAVVQVKVSIETSNSDINVN